PLDVPERWEAARLLRAAHGQENLATLVYEAVYADRDEALRSGDALALALWAGDYAAALPAFWRQAEDAAARGRLALEIANWVFAARCQIALGLLDDSRRSLSTIDSLLERWPGAPTWFTVLAIGARHDLTQATDSGWKEFLVLGAPLLESADPNLRWVMAAIH